MSQHKRARKEKRRESRSIQRELGRSGIKARMEEVRAAFRDKRFVQATRAWLILEEFRDPIRSVDKIRDLTLELLRSFFGCDTTGLDLKIGWYPEERRLDFRVVPTIGAAMQAMSAAKERRAPV